MALGCPNCGTTFASPSDLKAICNGCGADIVHSTRPLRTSTGTVTLCPTCERRLGNETLNDIISSGVKNARMLGAEDDWHH